MFAFLIGISCDLGKFKGDCIGFRQSYKYQLNQYQLLRRLFLGFNLVKTWFEIRVNHEIKTLKNCTRLPIIVINFLLLFIVSRSE